MVKIISKIIQILRILGFYDIPKFQENFERKIQQRTKNLKKYKITNKESYRE